MFRSHSDFILHFTETRRDCWSKTAIFLYCHLFKSTVEAVIFYQNNQNNVAIGCEKMHDTFSPFDTITERVL